MPAAGCLPCAEERLPTRGGGSGRPRVHACAYRPPAHLLSICPATQHLPGVVAGAARHLRGACHLAVDPGQDHAHPGPQVRAWAPAGRHTRALAGPGSSWRGPGRLLRRPPARRACLAIAAALAKASGRCSPFSPCSTSCGSSPSGWRWPRSRATEAPPPPPSSCAARRSVSVRAANSRLPARGGRSCRSAALRCGPPPHQPVRFFSHAAAGAVLAVAQHGQGLLARVSLRHLAGPPPAGGRGPAGLCCHSKGTLVSLLCWAGAAAGMLGCRQAAVPPEPAPRW